MPSALDFSQKPILVFWEMTKACKLKCRHCRAEAISEPLPGELSTEEGKKLIDDLKRFGSPYPVLILTGGDPLMRSDLEELIRYAKDSGLKLGVAPTVTEMLNDALSLFMSYGVKYISISLDGMQSTHNNIRGVEGHFERTVDILKRLARPDWLLQVNTLVAKETVNDLPKVVRLLYDLGVRTWELFFLIKVGRGIELTDLTPQEYEDLVHFLYEVAAHGFEVRTVEAPFFRRVISIRERPAFNEKDIGKVAKRFGLGPLYRRLSLELMESMGPPNCKPKLRSAHTRDGHGIIFVSYNGDIYPSGFAPFKLGNVRIDSLVTVYREDRLLKRIRRSEFAGKCGICEFRHICGGSRARALAATGDILGEDPACIYAPGALEK